MRWIYKIMNRSKERLFTIPNEIVTGMNGKEMFIQQIWNGKKKKKTLNCESSHYKISWQPKYKHCKEMIRLIPDRLIDSKHGGLNVNSSLGNYTYVATGGV